MHPVKSVTTHGVRAHFPGVQRWFAVVQGNGVRLSVRGQTHEVVNASAPLEFEGAATVDSWLLRGPEPLERLGRGERENTHTDSHWVGLMPFQYGANARILP